MLYFGLVLYFLQRVLIQIDNALFFQVFCVRNGQLSLKWEQLQLIGNVDVSACFLPHILSYFLLMPQLRGNGTVFLDYQVESYNKRNWKY